MVARTHPQRAVRRQGTKGALGRELQSGLCRLSWPLLCPPTNALTGFTGLQQHQSDATFARDLGTP